MTTVGTATQNTERLKVDVIHAGAMADEAETGAIELLKSQHREVEELFAKFDQTSDRAHKSRQKIVATIIEKLTLHAQIEEKIFYPAAKEADKSLVLEAYEEHANVKSMLRKLSNAEPSDEAYAAKVTVLKEMVKHHVKEEEQELFPACEAALGAEALVELGAKMQKRVEATIH